VAECRGSPEAYRFALHVRRWDDVSVLGEDGASGRVPFRIEDSVDSDGMLRLRLIGELDLAAAGGLSVRLERLIDDGGAVRLDLAGLDFIDSTGIHTLVRAVEAGRAGGGELFEVDRKLSDQVQRVVDLVGVGQYFWPADDEI
ncbi:MAG: STAS domain-containing protein, partial [Solirubrobacteraceae bacterium]